MQTNDSVVLLVHPGKSCHCLRHRLLHKAIFFDQKTLGPIYHLEGLWCTHVIDWGCFMFRFYQASIRRIMDKLTPEHVHQFIAVQDLNHVSDSHQWQSVSEPVCFSPLLRIFLGDGGINAGSTVEPSGGHFGACDCRSFATFCHLRGRRLRSSSGWSSRYFRTRSGVQLMKLGNVGMVLFLSPFLPSGWWCQHEFQAQSVGRNICYGWCFCYMAYAQTRWLRHAFAVTPGCHWLLNLASFCSLLSLTLIHQLGSCCWIICWLWLICHWPI